MKMETMSDLANLIKDTFDRLRSGESSVEQAQAEIRALNSMQSGMAIRLEHARLTGRLIQGSDVLPDMKLNPSAEPSAVQIGSAAAAKTLTSRKRAKAA
jgi:hypothetical protein